MPCRLQNDSPPSSINPSEDSGIDVDTKAADEWPSDVQPLPASLAKSIDESNYVRLSSLTAALSSAAANKGGGGDKPVDPADSDKVNELDGKANLLSSLYHATNQTANAYNAKAILSIVNQKNINNLNNLLNKSNLSCINTTKPADGHADMKAALISNVDFNKNGLPTPNTIVPNSEPTKLNGNFNRNSQSYVIQSNGSCAVNGTELAATKGKHQAPNAYFLVLMSVDFVMLISRHLSAQFASRFSLAADLFCFSVRRLGERREEAAAANKT